MIYIIVLLYGFFIGVFFDKHKDAIEFLLPEWNEWAQKALAFVIAILWPVIIITAVLNIFLRSYSEWN